MFHEQLPDAVFVDVKMPVLDGCEATRRMRQHPRGGSVPIVLVSASVPDNHAGLAQACGANGLLRKPLRADVVFEELRQMLGVQYEYREELEPPSSKRGVAAVDAGAVMRLGADLREALRDAVELGYVDSIHEYVCRVEEQEPILGEALRRCAQAYDYDEMLRLLEERTAPP